MHIIQRGGLIWLRAAEHLSYALPLRLTLTILAAVACLAGCAREQPEVVEVRTWDEGCYRARGAGPLPPDTIAYPPGRRSEFRVVALGGCVDAQFYEREREIYSVLDSLIVPGTVTAWPFDSWATLTVRESDSTTTPRPLERARTVVLADSQSFNFWQFGFSPEFGLLWIEGHHGPNSRLIKVERTPGDSVVFEWADPRYPLGGPHIPLSPRDVEVLDSLDAVMGRRLDSLRVANPGRSSPGV